MAVTAVMCEVQQAALAGAPAEVTDARRPKDLVGVSGKVLGDDIAGRLAVTQRGQQLGCRAGPLPAILQKRH